MPWTNRAEAFGLTGLLLCLTLSGLFPPSGALAAAPGNAVSPAASVFTDDSAPAAERTATAFDPSASYALWLERKDGRRDDVEEYSDNALAYAAETLSLYRQALPEDGNLCYVNVPVAAIAEKVTSGRTYVRWGSSMESGLSALAPDGVRVYNAVEILEAPLKAGESVYMTIDHHWTPLGAYYVCASMLADQRLPVLPYDEYAYTCYQSAVGPGNSTDTLALLQPLLPTRSLVVSKRVKEREIDLMDAKALNYKAYLNGTRLPWRCIVTGFHTGRRALVVCDSFGNAFAPYLFPYYDEVHLCDPRGKYYSKAQAGGSISQLMDYFHIDDAYIVLCTYNGANMRTSGQYQRTNLLP